MTSSIKCPVFGLCGGCAYWHLPYAEELELKRKKLQNIFLQHLPELALLEIPEVIASPKQDHYRHRLDLGVRRTKEGKIFIGFVSQPPRHLLDIHECPIAEENLSNFIPQFRKEIFETLPAKYKVASCVIKTDESGKVRWGGVGKGSLKLKEEEYFYVSIEGRKIHYSLDTFFQANHSILPLLFKYLKNEFKNKNKKIFLDLCAGVGLFSLALLDDFEKFYLVEDCSASAKLAAYNQQYHHIESWKIYDKKCEDILDELLNEVKLSESIALIDPPRKGLHVQACTTLAQSKLQQLYYLSCDPESLVKDLKIFIENGWSLNKIQAFDFFPKTPHIETLVELNRS